MNRGGWDLPPGCSMRDIDAQSEEAPDRCYECKRFLAADNLTGICRSPKCIEKFRERNRIVDEAEARLDAELEQGGKDYWSGK